MYRDQFKEFVCGGGLGSALKFQSRSFQRSGDQIEDKRVRFSFKKM